MRIILLLACVALLSGFRPGDQRTASDQPLRGIRALLVQLNTHSQKVALLRQQGDPRLSRYIEQCRKMNEIMIRDFDDHFNYVDVYYFYDTTRDEVIAHRFAGVLLDHKLQPLPAGTIPDGDTNYVIARWGKQQTVQDKTPNGQLRNTGYTHASSEGFSLFDHRFEPVFPGYLSPPSLRLDRIFNPEDYGKYNFQSRDFDLSYVSQAARMNRLVNTDFVKVPTPDLLRARSPRTN